MKSKPKFHQKSRQITNTSIVGTVENIEIVELSDSEKSIYLKIHEWPNWLVNFDDQRVLSPEDIKKGNKYLFKGDLSFYEPTLVAENIFIKSQSAEIKNIFDKGSNNQKMVAITGKISEIVLRSTKRGAKIATVRFIKIPNFQVMFFDEEQIEKCHILFKEKKGLTVTGELNLQEPQFDVEIISPVTG